MNDEFTIIHAYTRREALADGVLKDASAMAQEAGFRVPVALTAAAWARCVVVPPGASDQDEAGRLWDVLSVLRFAVGSRNRDARELRYRLCVVTRAGEAPEPVELKALMGPDDDGAPCLTIMLPDED